MNEKVCESSGDNVRGIASENVKGIKVTDICVSLLKILKKNFKVVVLN